MNPRTKLKIAALAFVLGFSLTQGATRVLAAGPFSDLTGDWSGSGYITMSDGKRERLRCRASYSVTSAGEAVDIAIRCASDSYKFDLSGYLRNSNGAVSGQWSETNFNSAGTLSGRASGNSIKAQAVGSTFSAGLSMTTSGSHQSVTILPGVEQVRQVSLTFQKR
jgi:hypothetical protein